MIKRVLVATLVMVTIWSCDKEKDQIVVVNTEFGEIHMLLYDETPLHKTNFLKLANDGYYDSTSFHRIIDGFMIQGGDENSKDDDPNNDGQGGPGYTIPAEFNSKFYHKKGALAAARTGGPSNPEMRSSGSQFYITQGRVTSAQQLKQMENSTNVQKKNKALGDYIKEPANYKDLEELTGYQKRGSKDSVNMIVERLRPLAEKDLELFAYSDEQIKDYSTLGGTPHLDGGYTVFGEVIQGIDIVDKIAKQPKGRADRPTKDIRITVKVLEMKKSKVEETYGYKYPVVESVEIK